MCSSQVLLLRVLAASACLVGVGEAVCSQQTQERSWVRCQAIFTFDLILTTVP